MERLKPKMLGMDEPVAGKSILLPVEGGFGDFVLFSRYVDVLLQEGAREVVIEQFDSWRDVVRPREGIRHTVPTLEARAEEAQRCDRVATVFHLWARYQSWPYAPQGNPAALIGLQTATALPPEASALMRARGPRPKVGLIWRSASGARHEPYRSMQLSELAAVLADAACDFYSLQVGELSEAERNELTAMLSGGRQAARRLKRAQILLAAEAGSSDEAIAACVGVGTSTVYRTKRRFVEGNLPAALQDLRHHIAEHGGIGLRGYLVRRQPGAPGASLVDMDD